MLQWFIRLSEFVEFTEISIPFRENSNRQEIWVQICAVIEWKKKSIPCWIHLIRRESGGNSNRREDSPMEAFYVAFLVLRLQNGFIFGEFLFWCFLCKFENRNNQHLQIWIRLHWTHLQGNARWTSLNSGRSRGDGLNTPYLPPHPRQNFSHFNAFFGNFGKIVCSPRVSAEFHTFSNILCV